MNDVAHDLRRLQWQCRRGMRELDLLLNAFLARGLHSLAESDRQHFETLLGLNDHVLAGWLLGEQIPADQDMARLVRAIRNSV